MALDFFAGCVGGCAGLLVGHPFDTVKVSLQTQDFRKPIYSGTYDCVKKIIQRDSFKGLYRGLSSPMMSVSFINAILFGVYGNVQRRSGDPESLMTHFCAGAASGLVQTFIASPMELVKSRLQVQHDMPNATVKHAGSMSCLNHIWKTEGIRGVYKGFGITVVRDVPGLASYFVSFEWLMSRKRDPSAFYTLMVGGFAGTFSWLISFPMDVVKSRLQVDGMNGKPQYSGSMDCIRKSIAAEGYSFFTRGLTSTLLRAFPTNAVCFLVVSSIMKYFSGSSIEVNVDLEHAKPHKLVQSGSSWFQPPSVFTTHRLGPLSRYLIVLDGFHTVDCHNDMMELSDELRESLAEYSYFYRVNAEPLHKNLTDEDMKKPICV